MTTLISGAADTSIDAGTDTAAATVIPADIAMRLTQEQIVRLQGLLAARTSAHPVDYRISSSLFGRRFYLAFFAGNEARSWERLSSERQIRPIHSVLRDGVFTSLIVTFGLCVITAMIVAGMFALKWTTGINLLLG